MELSTFLVAAAKGDLAGIRKALDNGVKIDALMRIDGAWYRARAMRDAEALLRTWHKGYANAGRVLGRTALMLAILASARPVVEELLARGAQIKTR